MVHFGSRFATMCQLDGLIDLLTFSLLHLAQLNNIFGIVHQGTAVVRSPAGLLLEYIIRSKDDQLLTIPTYLPTNGRR